MNSWTKRYPPYEGDEQYIYLAFAPSDSRKVWKSLHPLFERGCRIWYSTGPAGNAEELLRIQNRASSASLTLVYLTDAACGDTALKSTVMVNQRSHRPIVCIDPDGGERLLAMGLYENVPQIRAYGMSAYEITGSVLRSSGFSMDMLEGSQSRESSDTVGRLTRLFLALASALTIISVAGYGLFSWFHPSYDDQVVLSDPAVISAVRSSIGRKPFTEELLSEVTCISLRSFPETWDDLAMLPGLERIIIPQDLLLEGGPLPEGDYVIELTGGGR